MGSTNSAKVEATRIAFGCFFAHVEVVPVAAHGQVEQPATDAQTRAGAELRVRRAAAAADGDWWVGIEGGVEEVAGALMVSAWAVVRHDGRSGHSRSASYTLPGPLAARVRAGTPLGDLTRHVVRSADPTTAGLVDTLSQGRLSRTDLYVQAVLLAMLPLLGPWQDLAGADPESL